MLLNPAVWSDHELTDNEVTWIGEQYARLCIYAEPYGRGSNTPCQKLLRKPEDFIIINRDNRGNKYVEGAPLQLTTRWITFVNEHGRIPKPGKCVLNRQGTAVYGNLSHLCGSRNCIKPEHIVFESAETNQERRKCHFWIRKYEQAHQGWKSDDDVFGVVNIDKVRGAGGDWAEKVSRCKHGLNGLPGDHACFVNFGSIRSKEKKKRRRSNRNHNRRKRRRLR